MAKRLTQEARFTSRVAGQMDLSGCLLWRGSVSSDGYGTLAWNGKQMAAHRVAYALHVGEIPDGMEVMHTCDNPICVNPPHLRLGTHYDNMRDKIDKKRANFTGSGKLSRDKAAEIRASRHEKRNVLAARYGVSRITIKAVLSGRTWNHE